jgi:hypothetical protein
VLSLCQVSRRACPGGLAGGEGTRCAGPGRWGGKAMTLPELVEHEKKERKELAKLFKWPQR